MYQFNDVRTKKDKKNERNRLYRELSAKKKDKSPEKGTNDKVTTIKYYRKRFFFFNFLIINRNIGAHRSKKN